MYSVVCVGGAPIRPQIMEIKRGVDFIIGTPGRLMDLMKQGYLTVDHVHSVVLDEADRMLDMGFIDDMKRILSKVPADVQKVVFTVTIYEHAARNQNFGMVSNAYIRVLDQGNGSEIARYDLSEDASTVTAMIFGELYRHNGEWKFNAVGTPTKDRTYKDAINTIKAKFL